MEARKERLERGNNKSVRFDEKVKFEGEYPDEEHLKITNGKEQKPKSS
ncbi:MAG: hypothetical protein ACJAW3_000508 [Lentimonas sp.]|jgi:hypothetical protein